MGLWSRSRESGSACSEPRLLEYTVSKSGLRPGWTAPPPPSHLPSTVVKRRWTSHAMSLQHSEPQTHDALASGATEPPSKSTYRSFKYAIPLTALEPVLTPGWCRKKFHKMKLSFDDAMKESDKLFKEEQKIIDILRRLQAQNE